MTQFSFQHPSEQDFAIGQAIAALEQPRLSTDAQSRQTLPYSDSSPQIQSMLFQRLPFDCRVSIWESVLCTQYTRIDRWRPFFSFPSELYGMDFLDSPCFPYRVRTVSPMLGQLPKPERPVSLLLCCRQLYLEAIKALYSCTTFVFDTPKDLHSFSLIVSPEGLASIRSVILNFGIMNWSGSGPLCPQNSRHALEAFDAWPAAFSAFPSKLPGLQELQVWLSRRRTEEDAVARRPWDEGKGNEEVDRRHLALFELFASVKVPRFMVNLVWRPTDVLEQREWPFRVNIQTRKQMYQAETELPERTDIMEDLYDA